MRGRSARRPACLAGFFAVAAALLATAAFADDPDDLRHQAGELRASNAAIAVRSERALLELYALESRLARAERRVAALESRKAELERRRAVARHELGLARATLAAAQRQLADRLQQLYIEGDVDPLAILLGADSLADAIEALNGFDSLAAHDRAIIDEVQAAQARLEEALRRLARERAELRAVLAEAKAARAALAEARGERAAYVARLARERRLNEAEIARLTARADAIEARAQEIARQAQQAAAAAPQPAAAAAPAAVGAPAVSPAPAPGASPVALPPAGAGRQMTVVATAYALPGTTASGMPVGWGVVAVDPAVIPLGTRMTIPGYGAGVAADTGSAIRGARIDVWFPTVAQARAWGVRTVTITLHP